MTSSSYKLPEHYSFKSIWRITLPILVSLVMEELLGLTGTAFLGASWVMLDLSVLYLDSKI